MLILIIEGEFKEMKLNKKGFTLVELLAVIVVLAVVMSDESVV